MQKYIYTCQRATKTGPSATELSPSSKKTNLIILLCEYTNPKLTPHKPQEILTNREKPLPHDLHIQMSGYQKGFKTDKVTL